MEQGIRAVKVAADDRFKEEGPGGTVLLRRSDGATSHLAVLAERQEDDQRAQEESCGR